MFVIAIKLFAVSLNLLKCKMKPKQKCVRFADLISFKPLRDKKCTETRQKAGHHEQHPFYSPMANITRISHITELLETKKNKWILRPAHCESSDQSRSILLTLTSYLLYFGLLLFRVFFRLLGQSFELLGCKLLRGDVCRHLKSTAVANFKENHITADIWHKKNPVYLPWAGISCLWTVRNRGIQCYSCDL